MDIQLLEKHFGQIGARVKIFGPSEKVRRSGIDIRSDKIGEYFSILISGKEEIEYEVVDLKPDMRHLLLMARRENGKDKFLCGHDERHWFVCAVPGKSISNVVNAMEALQPEIVRGRILKNVLRRKDVLSRRNEAFVRQGEWFFVPVSELPINPSFFNPIHKNEPITRGRGSQSHICEEVFRGGGELVWVCSAYPSGISPKRYAEVLKTKPEAARWRWQTFVRDAKVYARGTVRHPDHKTIVLSDWHQVLMNTENEAPGMQHVVFLD